MKKLLKKLQDKIFPPQRWIIKVRLTMKGDRWLVWATQERNNNTSPVEEEVQLAAIKGTKEQALQWAFLELADIPGRKKFEIWDEFTPSMGWKEFLS